MKLKSWFLFKKFKKYIKKSFSKMFLLILCKLCNIFKEHVETSIFSKSFFRKPPNILQLLQGLLPEKIENNSSVFFFFKLNCFEINFFIMKSSRFFVLEQTENSWWKKSNKNLKSSLIKMLFERFSQPLNNFSHFFLISLKETFEERDFRIGKKIPKNSCFFSKLLSLEKTKI